MKHELYHTWQSMKQRCLNPNTEWYHRYGGRGITVCDEWINSFDTFVSDMGKRPIGHTLDRIDNDGPYCKDNCKWSLPIENSRNKENAIFVTHDGVEMLLIEWCESLDLDYNVLKSRYNRGDRGDKLFRPIRRYRKIIVDGEP